MSNAQVRLLASAIALLAGGIIANTSNIDVNVSIAIILISSIIFIVEYWRLQKPEALEFDRSILKTFSKFFQIASH